MSCTGMLCPFSSVILNIGVLTKLSLFFPVVCLIRVFDQTLAEQLYRDKGLSRTQSFGYWFGSIVNKGIFYCGDFSLIYSYFDPCGKRVWGFRKKLADIFWRTFPKTFLWSVEFNTSFCISLFERSGSAPTRVTLKSNTKHEKKNGKVIHNGLN